MARRAIFAIRAFNIETALIQDAVKTTDIGSMRIAWWKNSIDDALIGKPLNHPVLLEIAEATSRCKLSKIWFSKILRQRLDLLTRSSFSSLDALETYSDETASSLLYLQLEAMNIQNLNIEHACGHLGKAIGTMTVLKSVVHSLNSSHRIYIPSQILSKVRNRQKCVSTNE